MDLVRKIKDFDLKHTNRQTCVVAFV